MTRRSRGVLLSLAAALAGCGGGGEGDGEVPVARVEIARTSVFLPQVGATTQLTAQALDANGVPVSATITWASSTPDQVAVDSTGTLTASQLGSAQIFAEAGGVRSLPTLVLVAEPAAGAVLVSDAQVVAIGPPQLGAGERPGIGTLYDVTLSGVAPPPAPGTVVLPTGDAAVGGKVIATREEGANLVVTLALAPVDELLARYSMAWTIDLGPFAEAQGPSALVVGDGPPDALTAALVGGLPFVSFTCDGGLSVSSVEKVVNVTPSVGLSLEVVGEKLDPVNPTAYVKRAVKGTLSIDGTVKLVFQPGFSASGSCLASYPIRLHLFGLLSLVVMPEVRIGIGVQAKAGLEVARGEIGVTGSLVGTVEAGFECGEQLSGCRSLDSKSFQSELKPVVKVPRLDGMHVELEAQVFAFVGLDAVFLLTFNAPILDAKVGPKQSFDLGFEEDQASNPGYASSYRLADEGVIEPAEALQEAIAALFPGPASVTFEARYSRPRAHSPTGLLSADKGATGPGQPVTFDVALDEANLRYPVLDYNVLGVQLWRKLEGAANFELLTTLPVLSSGDQARFQHVWTPTEADVGVNEFAAFVQTQLDPLIPAEEIAPDSRVTVEVKCFSAPAPAGAARARAAGQCVTTWSGTSRVEIETAEIANATVTWSPEEDPTLPEGQVRYRPSGSMSVEFVGWANEGCTVSPTTFLIDPADFDAGELVIDYSTDPWTYRGGGGELVRYTVTCPDVTPAEFGPVILWFGALPDGEVDGVRIHGSGTFSGGVPGTTTITTTYDFLKD